MQNSYSVYFDGNKYKIVDKRKNLLVVKIEMSQNKIFSLVLPLSQVTKSHEVGESSQKKTHESCSHQSPAPILTKSQPRSPSRKEQPPRGEKSESCNVALISSKPQRFEKVS
ncbi:hypothetical protein ACOSQ2_028426 [Xanthoceras sorbifolium]